MWSNNTKVNLPNDLLKDMAIHATVISPSNPDVGILILTKNLHQFSRDIVVRIYRLQKESNDGSFSIVCELEAFRFKSYKSAKDFLDKLPNMTGLEMLLLLNPLPQIDLQ